MKKQLIHILQNAGEVCNGIANAITKRNNGQPFCQNYRPGEDRLVIVIQQLINAIKDIEPECSVRLAEEIQNVKHILPNKCINPYSFGAIVAIVTILKQKYLGAQIHIHNTGCSRKFFISHSSNDKIIVNGFIKELLKIGCGFKDADIFCTLDSTAIRTGDDFREKIVENMKSCDFILLFISEDYMKSEICHNEMGAAWALDNKRILPFVLPGTTFNQMGFLNIVKQGASIADKSKLDEFYKEVCEHYAISPDWPSFNKAKEDFIGIVNSIQ